MRKSLLIGMATAAIIGISWYSFAKGIEKKEVRPNVLNDATLTLAIEQESGDLNTTDKRILEELQGYFTSFTSTAPLYITGKLQAEDPADTTLASSSPFVFFRHNTTLYYAVKDQMLYNDAQHYTVVDHSSRKLLVMPPRTIAETNALPLNFFSKTLKEDHYQLERREEKGIITFRIWNEQHMACKEMIIQVTAATRVPLSIFYRFTDLDHPEEKEWDKKMTMEIMQWSTDANALQAFHLRSPLDLSNEGIKPSKDFETYEVMDLTRR